MNWPFLLEPKCPPSPVLRRRTWCSSRNGQFTASLFCPGPQRDWGSPTHMGEGTFFTESMDLNTGLAKSSLGFFHKMLRMPIQGRGHGRGQCQPRIPLSVWGPRLQGRRCFLRWRGWAGPSTERKLPERGPRDRKTHACQKRWEAPGRRAVSPVGLQGLQVNPGGFPGHLEASGPRPVALRASAPTGPCRLSCIF